MRPAMLQKSFIVYAELSLLAGSPGKSSLMFLQHLLEKRIISVCSATSKKSLCLGMLWSLPAAEVASTLQSLALLTKDASSLRVKLRGSLRYGLRQYIQADYPIG